MPGMRRFRILALAIAFILISLYTLRDRGYTGDHGYTPYISRPSDDEAHWVKVPEQHPISHLIPLPTGSPKKIPKVQASQPKEDAAQKKERLERREAVKESFIHSWEGYKDHAWLHDEVAPLSERWKDTFGGWAATLVDSLDTLWIMGLIADFEMAVTAVGDIDFGTTKEKEINVFETTIRYLGGLLAAYDIKK
jgi:mannosyl-oligosaccharide alpha-1,2-mannosidase